MGSTADWSPQDSYALLDDLPCHFLDVEFDSRFFWEDVGPPGPDLLLTGP